jgi:hypothetical protein
MTLITIQTDPAHIRAAGAFSGTSFVPEKREANTIKGYIDHMAAVAAEFEKWATADNAAQINADLEQYRAKYVAKENAYLAAHSRVMSTMIAGPSKFPTRMMEKRNATVNKRLNELVEWQEKALDRLRSTYNPARIANAPIMADDPDGVAKLQEKLDQLKANHEKMKAHNKIMRGKGTAAEKMTALTALHGDEAAVIKELKNLGIMGANVYTFALTNNGANIKRIEERVKALSTQQAAVASGAAVLTENTIANGVTVERDPADVRLRLRFPDKPVAAVRELLKKHGFHYSPTQTAWQRQLTNNAEWTLREITPKLQEFYP